MRLAHPLGYLLRGLVFLDRHISLLAVLQVEACDLAVFDSGRNGVLAGLVNHMVTVGFDLVAEQLLTGKVVMFSLSLALSLSLRISGTDHRDQADDGKNGHQITMSASHVDLQ